MHVPACTGIMRVTLILQFTSEIVQQTRHEQYCYHASGNGNLDLFGNFNVSCSVIIDKNTCKTKTIIWIGDAGEATGWAVQGMLNAEWLSMPMINHTGHKLL